MTTKKKQTAQLPERRRRNTGMSSRELSGPFQAVAGALLVAAVCTAAIAVVKGESNAIRIESLERDREASANLGQQIGTLSADVRTLKDEVGRLRDDLNPGQRKK